MQPIPGGTRAEHLAWAKQRALEYCDTGDVHQAFASLTSDLRKHDELRDHGGIELGMLLILSGHLGSVREMREHIEGCQ